jgi:hypothetical protein
MAEIPRSVLSEHFQERMEGRRLRAAVFLTFRFEPGFFEQEVLPVFMDVPLSHAVKLRLVQLEDVLRDLPGEIAVYYDVNGLRATDDVSARLDVRRIPIRHQTGIFHPKNVFLLTESVVADDEGHHDQTLIVASMSANLTRAGWWQNVESCHVEEITEGESTRLKADLVSFLKGLRRKAMAPADHLAVGEILTFLGGLSPRKQKSTAGRLHTHFFLGNRPLIDFLEQTAGHLIRDSYLEVLSPYFDDAGTCQPLQRLIDRFQPRAVRVFLPRSPSGEALCRPDLYESVREMPKVKWGYLPHDLLRSGPSSDSVERTVHAKVYRFFTQNPKREICFVGSVNLTNAAHQSGGNFETGFLVELEPPRRPDFWLTPFEQDPPEFKTPDDGETAASGGTRLNLRYHWDTSTAAAFWDAPKEAPALQLEARSIMLGDLPPLASRVWIPLGPELTRRIEEHLDETSIFLVHGEGPEPGLLLIQEEAMAHKPSLFLSLSAADILQYWSLLTPAQRTAFLEAHADASAILGPGADLIATAKFKLEQNTLFDRFAGFFHAFGCLERNCRSALERGHDKEVAYRLFGKKYDSLGCLLDRVAEDVAGDDVDHYLIVSCAKQLCRQIASDYPAYWSDHAAETSALTERIESLAAIRQRIIERNPPDMARFLDWFDCWFGKRAAPAEVAP